MEDDVSTERKRHLPSRDSWGLEPLPPILPACIADPLRRANVEEAYFEWATLGMSESERVEQRDLMLTWPTLPCYPPDAFTDVALLVSGAGFRRKSINTFKMDFSYFGEAPTYVPAAPPLNSSRANISLHRSHTDNPGWEFREKMRHRLPIFWNSTRPPHFRMAPEHELPLLRRHLSSTFSDQLNRSRGGANSEGTLAMISDVMQSIGSEHRENLTLAKHRNLSRTEVLQSLWNEISPNFYDTRDPPLPVAAEDPTWVEGEWHEGPLAMASTEWTPDRGTWGNATHPSRFKYAIFMPGMTCMSNMWHGFLEHVLPLWDIVQRLGWDPELVLFISSAPLKHRWGIGNVGCRSRNKYPFGWWGGWVGDVFQRLFGFKTAQEFHTRVIFSGEKYPQTGLVFADLMVTGAPKICLPLFPWVPVGYSDRMDSRSPFYRAYDQNRYGPYCASLLESVRRRVFHGYGYPETVEELQATSRPGVPLPGIIRLPIEATSVTSDRRRIVRSQEPLWRSSCTSVGFDWCKMKRRSEHENKKKLLF